MKFHKKTGILKPQKVLKARSDLRQSDSCFFHNL